MNHQILIAEDEAVTRAAIHESLRGLLPGAVFHLAANGVEAVEKAGRLSELHIAFLDVKMPGMDGMEAARHIRGLWRECEIIFLTAYSEYELIREALDLGATDYILKPFSQTGLSVAVQKAERRLTFQRSAQERLDKAEQEREKLSRWVDDRLFMDMLGRETAGATLAAQLDKVGILFQSGAFAALRCPTAAATRRVEGLVRGSDWEAHTKVFLQERGEYLFLLVISSLREEVADLLARQMTGLCDKIRRLMHVQIQCAVGDTFQDLSQVHFSCFGCYELLSRCTREQPLLRRQGSMTLLDELIRRGEGQRACQRMGLWLDYFRVQQVPLSGRQEQISLMFTDVCRKAGRPEEVWVDLRVRLLACGEEGALEECARRLVLELCAAGAEGAASDAETSDLEGKIAVYLQENFRQELTLERLADAFGLSRTYFSKLFKRLFGQNFVPYLAQLRIEEAKRLLASPEISVREAGLRSGFQEASYFTSTFRKAVGQTPSEYRQSVLEEGKKGGRAI